jgi:hypothetical protein
LDATTYTAKGGNRMSVYIKGMEMPTSCFQCEFRTKIDPDNLMCTISQKTFEDRFYHIEHRDESCPLVPVPEHGRLIDADALLKMLHLYFADGKARNAFEGLIRTEPTIIPADPAEEGEG